MRPSLCLLLAGIVCLASSPVPAAEGANAALKPLPQLFEDVPPPSKNVEEAFARIKARKSGKPSAVAAETQAWMMDMSRQSSTMFANPRPPDARERALDLKKLDATSKQVVLDWQHAQQSWAAASQRLHADYVANRDAQMKPNDARLHECEEKEALAGATSCEPLRKARVQIRRAALNKYLEALAGPYSELRATLKQIMSTGQAATEQIDKGAGPHRSMPLQFMYQKIVSAELNVVTLLSGASDAGLEEVRADGFEREQAGQ